MLIISLFCFAIPGICQKTLVFDENTLSVIDKKLYEYERLTPITEVEGAIYPILVASLLDNTFAYDDETEFKNYDTTYHGRFNPGKILKKNSRPWDIYRIVVRGSTGAYNHILLVNGEKMTFINMRQSYDKVMRELLAYFKHNKDVDERLFPLYNSLIIDWFMRNHMMRDQSGKWYDWFERKDPLSRDYLKFQYPEFDQSE